MILVISDEYCATTNFVLEWLTKFGIKYIRINQEDRIEIKEIRISNRNTVLILSCNSLLIDFVHIKAVWYRRGGLNFNYKINTSKYRKSLEKQIVLHGNLELFEITDFLYSELKKKKNIGLPGYHHVNKLSALRIAKKFKLAIPETSIITKLKKNKIKEGIITKGIRNLPIIGDNKFYFESYTKRVISSRFSKEVFFPSLIQEEIKKDYEIRTFYLKGRCYSMAIFSQNDELTKVDFRNYNQVKPNRCVPVILPNNIIKSIKLFMNYINLNCGSLDLIKTKKGEYVFLEINPVGQFGMVSIPCNYHLERRVAEVLKNYAKEESYK